MRKIKWRAIIALVLIVAVIYFNVYWVWGVVFLFWAIPDVISGVTYLAEPVERKANPILYWLIISTWMLTSSYLLVDRFTPEILPVGWGSSYQLYSSEEMGEYITNDLESNNDTIFYKNHVSDGFNIVGISVLANDESTTVLEDLWKKFEANDISIGIPDILEDKIYVVQTDFNKEKEGYYRLTIGYKTKSVKNISKGLVGVKVKPSKYAVFELSKEPEKELEKQWTKIFLSDIEMSNLNNVEVYHFDYDTEKLNKIDLWVSVPTAKSDLAKLPKSSLSSPLDKKEIVAVPLIKPFVPDRPNTNTTAEIVIEESPTISLSALTVIGLQSKANFRIESELKLEIEKLWKEFSKQNYAKYILDIEDDTKVYFVYSNYTETEVTLTLGYKTKTATNYKLNKGLTPVTIKANDYYNFPINTTSSNFEGDEWTTDYELLEFRKASSVDIEEYTLNKKYEVIDAQMWVGAK